LLNFREFNFTLFAAMRNLRTVIVLSLRKERPAIVLTRFQKIDFVSTSRPVFRAPQFPGTGIEFEALRTTVTIAPDRLQCRRVTNKGVIRRNSAIISYAMNLAIGERQVLDRIATVRADAKKT
jgi:hypothetical protein